MRSVHGHGSAGERAAGAGVRAAGRARTAVGGAGDGTGDGIKLRSLGYLGIYARGCAAR